MIPLALLQVAAKAAPYAIAGALAVTAYQLAPILGVNAQRHHLEHQRDTYHTLALDWQTQSGRWKASYYASEAARKLDQTGARQAIEAGTASCNLRVAEARKSAEAIKRIVERPVKVDAGGCPVRSVVSADDLRDALGAR